MSLRCPHIPELGPESEEGGEGARRRRAASWSLWVQEPVVRNSLAASLLSYTSPPEGQFSAAQGLPSH